MSGSKTKSPITARPRRVAGQSVEEERDRIVDDVVGQWLFMAVMMLAMAAMEWYRDFFNIKPTPVLFTVLALGFCGVAAWRIWRVLPELRALKLARDGERAVGQFLEELRAHGYRVFHDLIGDGFNVDHVLVGPAGVFTIETKTWSKPARGLAEIHFDGERIKTAGRQPDRDPIVQAKAQANWIKRLLHETSGRMPYIKPVVVFPGWYIVNAKGTFNEVWVLEPKALPAFLANEPERIAPEDVQLFAYHLSRHIRAEEAK